VFSTEKQREQERERRVAMAAFPILDEFEEEDWESGRAGKDPLSDQAAAARAADYFARLLMAYENDSSVLPNVTQVWYGSRRKPFDVQGDDDRASHFLGTMLSLMNSYGNLFGSFRETTPAFDPVKAAQRVGGEGGDTESTTRTAPGAGAARQPAV